MINSSSRPFYPIYFPEIDGAVLADEAGADEVEDITSLNEDQIEEDRPNFLAENSYPYQVLKKAVILSSVCVLDHLMSSTIAHIATKQFGLCLEKILPLNGYHYLRAMANPLVTFNKSIKKLFGSNISADVFVPAICEELEFRWLLQSQLLNEIPKRSIHYLSPDYANYLDSTLAKISRIVLTALIFSCLHTNTLSCESSGGFPELIGGLLYGTIYEFKIQEEGLVDTINLHCIFNLMSDFIQSSTYNYV